MKPTDLQTGDFIKYLGNVYIVEEISAKGWVHLIYPKTKARLNLASDYIINLLEPIPLTAEILERNGFSKVPQTKCSNPYHWTLDVYEEESEELLYSIKAYKTLFRGMYISIDNYADCEPIKFSKQIEHFHEMQHALRLCGLSDLSENLKVEE